MSLQCGNEGMDPFERVNCILGGITLLCTGGDNRRCSGASVISCARRATPPQGSVWKLNHHLCSLASDMLTASTFLGLYITEPQSCLSFHWEDKQHRRELIV